MQITPNFKLGEFACKDGTPYPSKWIDSKLWPLCKDLEIIRDEVKTRVKCEKKFEIVSGYRTPSHNARIKGAAKHSRHMSGDAVDFKCIDETCEPKVSPHELHYIVEELIKSGKIKAGGLGLYKTHVHYDHRPVVTGFGPRWDKSKRGK